MLQKINKVVNSGKGRIVLINIVRRPIDNIGLGIREHDNGLEPEIRKKEQRVTVDTPEYLAFESVASVWIGAILGAIYSPRSRADFDAPCPVLKFGDKNAESRDYNEIAFIIIIGPSVEDIIVWNGCSQCGTIDTFGYDPYSLTLVL